MRHRGYQCLLIGTFLPFCWLAMMGVHELGHALAGWLTGGTVTKVVLHPLTISRTDVEPNPAPLAVVWGGPVVGVVLPLLIWSGFRIGRLRYGYLTRFFTGFCLIANGSYIGFGSLDAIGDAGEMTQLGSPFWTLWLFGAITVPTGFWLWHGQGPHFGLGRATGNVDGNAALISLILLTAMLLLTVTLSPHG